MTYLVTYGLFARVEHKFGSVFQKRGSFVVDADDAAEATTRARSVLDDAVKYGVDNLGMPANVRVHIASVLPTVRPQPSFENVVDALKGTR